MKSPEAETFKGTVLRKKIDLEFPVGKDGTRVIIISRKACLARGTEIISGITRARAIGLMKRLDFTLSEATIDAACKFFSEVFREDGFMKVQYNGTALGIWYEKFFPNGSEPTPKPKEDTVNLIADIVVRAKDVFDVRDTDMIISLTNRLSDVKQNYPLNLTRLLSFPDFDFYHDISGIMKFWNLNRREFDHCFSPRCTEVKSSVI